MKLYAHECNHSLRPEEGMRSPRVGNTRIYESFDLGAQLRSSGGALHKHTYTLIHLSSPHIKHLKIPLYENSCNKQHFSKWNPYKGKEPSFLSAWIQEKSMCSYLYRSVLICASIHNTWAFSKYQWYYIEKYDCWHVIKLDLTWYVDWTSKFVFKIYLVSKISINQTTLPRFSRQ